MKLIWLTDIHLNFLEKARRVNFYDLIIASQGDVILITGDIAEAPMVVELLQEMAAFVKLPIYFVLGNHDYYLGQIETVHEAMHEITENHEYLNWMPAKGSCLLKEKILLLGQDGWADGRYGDYTNSRVIMNDSRLIADFFQQKITGKFDLLNKMQELADKDANQLKQDCLTAIEKHHPNKIIIITHVPPFPEACLHKGKQNLDDWLPFFSSKATGDILLSIAENNTNTEFLVLCGHTHEAAVYQPLDNLVIKVGRAEYYHPEVGEVFWV